MKQLLFATAFLIALASCQNHGKKIQVDGTETEIFYKGEGVTESDAKKTGDLLKKEFIKSNDKKASVQVTNEKDAYTIRFVYDEEIYKTLKNVDNEFKALAVQASKEVFNGKKVNIALADEQFKDWKTISWDEDFAKTTEESTDATYLANKDEFEHDSAGDVDFYWAKNIPDEEVERIAKYIVDKGDFSGGTSQLIITNVGGTTLIRFPVKESFLSDPQIMATIEGVTKDLKDNLFPSSPFSFQVTDEKLKVVKSWDY